LSHSPDASPRLRDRHDAGERLGEALREYAGRPDVIVLGLPRGGVPVAAVVARALRAPLDVLPVRKLGLPGQPEMAMGAIASGGAQVLDHQTVAAAVVTPGEIARVAQREELELARREATFRRNRPPLEVAGRCAIVVDDGMATGCTMRAAVLSLRRRRAAHIVVAVPVASAEACAALSAEADRCFCLSTPTPFFSVGEWYQDFAQLEDEDVQDILARDATGGGGA
jgi:putative phosphoribosyl transferase